MSNLLEMLRGLEDPRRNNAHYRLGDILMIAVAGSLCGAESCVEYAQFARSRRALLEGLLGRFDPPSHDTFSRIFRMLKSEEFYRAFSQFMVTFAGAVQGVIGIDGKSLRRAYEKGMAASPPMMVTAWASEARLALAAVFPDIGTGGNEIEAALAIVDLLELDGAVITADALHCHRRMAQKIKDNGGDYVLCLKGNRQALHSTAKALLAAAEADPSLSRAQIKEVSHGRHDVRTARVIHVPGFGDKHKFAGACAIAEIVSERSDGKPKTRIFLLSKAWTAHEILAIVRAHWHVENRLHWSLDVILGEDMIRSRTDNGPANLAVAKRIALNILNKINDAKSSIRVRMKRCAWEDDYLLNALATMQ